MERRDVRVLRLASGEGEGAGHVPEGARAALRLAGAGEAGTAVRVELSAALQLPLVAAPAGPDRELGLEIRRGVAGAAGDRSVAAVGFDGPGERVASVYGRPGAPG